ncbi:hypothetical protein BC835DRAFT_1304495 [Cytidiella melzeri]|nr:hypothetical protein BC835DRAFT_1304495 [Cytidiella melzeri]
MTVSLNVIVVEQYQEEYELGNKTYWLLESHVGSWLLCKNVVVRMKGTKALVCTTDAKPSKGGQLTPDKMRSLITLYHKAETFITPETLSDAIDYAFLEQRSIVDSWVDKREKTHVDLKYEVESRRALPKLSSGNAYDSSMDGSMSFTMSSESVAGPWSSRSPERLRQLKAALYGTEASGDDVPRPGYEVLVEEHERVQQLLKQEREQ